MQERIGNNYLEVTQMIKIDIGGNTYLTIMLDYIAYLEENDNINKSMTLANGMSIGLSLIQYEKVLKLWVDHHKNKRLIEEVEVIERD